ncbi:uncharacterized [Tachysurus ichikawai]
MEPYISTPFTPEIWLALLPQTPTSITICQIFCQVKVERVGRDRHGSRGPWATSGMSQTATRGSEAQDRHTSPRTPQWHIIVHNNIVPFCNGISSCMSVHLISSVLQSRAVSCEHLGFVGEVLEKN